MKIQVLEIHNGKPDEYLVAIKKAVERGLKAHPDGTVQRIDCKFYDGKCDVIIDIL